MYMFNRYQEIVERHKTSDLSESQPTKGNIAGGLTTIEEKALGNIQKIGRECMVDGVLDKAEMPDGPGLWFMDSSSAAAEMVTLCAAAGFVVHFFPTGQGNIIGNPILPNVKICANPRTVRTMGEHVDVDVSGLLRKEMTPDEAGGRLAGHDDPHREREAHRGGGPGAPRVRADEALRERLSLADSPQKPETGSAEHVAGGRMHRDALRPPPLRPRNERRIVMWARKFDSTSADRMPLSPSAAASMTVIRFHDRFMRRDRNVLSGYDASEGALYALFLAVISGHDASPRLCAVDNADFGLNPRLARSLDGAPVRVVPGRRHATSDIADDAQSAGSGWIAVAG